MKKLLVVGVIVLFLGLACAPSINAKVCREIINKSSFNKENIVNYDCFVIAHVNEPIVQTHIAEMFSTIAYFFWMLADASNSNFNVLWILYYILEAITFTTYYLTQGKIFHILSGIIGTENSTFISYGDEGWVNGTSKSNYGFFLEYFIGFKINFDRRDEKKYILDIVGLCIVIK